MSRAGAVPNRPFLSGALLGRSPATEGSGANRKIVGGFHSYGLPEMRTGELGRCDSHPRGAAGHGGGGNAGAEPGPGGCRRLPARCGRLAAGRAIPGTKPPGERRGPEVHLCKGLLSSEQTDR